MHTDRVQTGQSVNVEFPIWLNPQLKVTETYYYSSDYYINNAGGLVSFVMNMFFWQYSFVAVMLAFIYTRQVAKIASKNYKESYNLNQIKKFLEKFRIIYSALSDRRKEPGYAEIIKELEEFLNYRFEKIDYDTIEILFNRMNTFDEFLPDVEDLEQLRDQHEDDTLALPMQQKILNIKIDQMIVIKAGMTFSQILSDLKERLSLYNVFCVYDEVDHNRAYVYANLSM